MVPSATATPPPLGKEQKDPAAAESSQANASLPHTHTPLALQLLADVNEVHVFSSH